MSNLAGEIMKIAFRAAVLLLTAIPCHAWMHLIPDYKSQLDAADLVAVVRVLKLTDTGSTNRLNLNSRLWFREFEVEMKMLSVFKGGATNIIKCRLYRFPTEQERNAELVEREDRMEYLKANPWESGLFIPNLHRDYLVYLKRSEPDSFVPATGIRSAIFSMLELKVPHNSDPDRNAKEVGWPAASGEVHSRTNGPSALGKDDPITK